MQTKKHALPKASAEAESAQTAKEDMKTLKHAGITGVAIPGVGNRGGSGSSGLTSAGKDDMKIWRVTLQRLKEPFIITSRLMAGLKIGNAYISIGQGERNGEGRTQYGVFIDLPDGSEHEVTDLRSGCQGGSLQEGFASLLSFLGAAAESYRYARMEGENSDLFPQAVTEWAYQNSDEISLLALEIEETPELICVETVKEDI